MKIRKNNDQYNYVQSLPQEILDLICQKVVAFDDLLALSLSSKFFKNNQTLFKYCYMIYIGTYYGEKITPILPPRTNYFSEFKTLRDASKKAAQDLHEQLFKKEEEGDYAEILANAISYLNAAKLKTGYLIPILRELLKLLESNTNAKLTIFGSSENFTLVRLCALTTQIPAIKYLHSQGANINTRNNTDETTLFDFISTAPKDMTWSWLSPKEIDPLNQNTKYMETILTLLNLGTRVSLWPDDTNDLDDSLFNLLCERNVGKNILEKYFALCTLEDFEKAHKSDTLKMTKNDTVTYATKFLKDKFSEDKGNETTISMKI